MAAPSFDPTHAVRFDLPNGAVRARGDDRVALVPTAALEELVRSSPPHAVEAFGRAMGAAIGKRAARSLGNPQSASIEAFVSHLSGEVATAGIGALSVERWGRALVILVEGCAVPDSVLLPLIAAALEAATGRRAECALLSGGSAGSRGSSGSQASHDGGKARILVGSGPTVGRVREWLASGLPFGEALVRLHGGQGA